MNAKIILIKLFGLDKPNNIKRVYKYYNILRFEFNKVPSWISFITATLSTIIILIATNDIVKAICTPFVIIVIYWVIIGVLYFVIQYLIQNAGVHTKFEFPGTFLVRNNEALACDINLENIDLDQFEFATPITAEESAIINFEAYEYSIWGTSVLNKLQRNLKHINKNPLSILLIKSKDKKSFIGFSHMLPVSKITWDDYINAKITDNGFPEKHIVSIGDNKAYGIIQFSLGMRQPNKSNYELPSSKHEIGELLEQASCVHFNSLKKMFRINEDIPVLLQNMGQEFISFYKDCADFGGMTKENAKIIMFKVSNT
jgi:uncharacterized protein YbaR (Trm112 family)